MGYMIRYGTDGQDHLKQRKKALTVAGIVIAIALCYFLFAWNCPEYAQRLSEALFPWLQPEVQQAFGEFREDIREGVPFVDAVEDFCANLLYET